MSNAALEPFPGPRAFEPEEERLFCGRDEEKNDLRDLIQTYSVVLLYSQSGAGKTSLLQAGLQPALRKDGIETLTARVGRATDRERGSPSGNIYVHSALGNSCDGTPTLKERFARKSGTRHVVVFDQFEELFTAFPERWRERKDLFLQVADAVQEDSELRVLLVPREEYLGQLEHYAGLLPFDLQIRYRLERLREEAALSAIEEPLKNFNCLIDPSSARRLIENLRKVRVRVGKEVRELDGEFIEPVHLQVVCRDLWRRRDPQGNTIAVSDKLDGVDEALRGFYESGVDRASRESRVSERVIRNWFENSVITASGTRRVLFKEEDSTDGLPNTTVAILEEERVIRSEPRASEQTCELAHDRLIGPIKTSNRACRARRRWVVWPVSALVLAVGAYSAYKMVRRILDLRVTERLLKQLPEDEAQGYSDLRYAETKEADAAVYRYQASEPSRHGPSGVDQAEARRKSQELEKDAENHYSNALRHYKSAISIYEALYRRGRIPGDEAAGVFTSLATLGKTGG